jgi:hypothetical protein
MICQSVSKWAKWNLRVYLYILSARRGYASVENMSHFLAAPTPRRWTAASVGALCYHSAIGPPSARSFKKEKKVAFQLPFLNNKYTIKNSTT